ncbi:MAG: hypothetical protein PHE56_14585, partial [Bacteroidales bacterium]|nr:hypothetical protein [Bacteroidales bacterium]
MKRITTTFLLLFILLKCFTENVHFPQFIPPSPNAQTFMKYGEYPVSSYTGVPNISIPIYTIQLKDITIPINFTYNASGIKVEEEASRVGLGWILNAGGIISQTIKGRYNDFDHGVYFNKYNEFKIDDLHGFNNFIEYTVYNRDFASFSVPDSFSITNFKSGIYNSSIGCGIIEMAPDIFTYNFLGYSGKFIFGRNGNIIKENNDNIQIIPTINQTSSLPLKLESFKIITPDGTKYYFNQTEKSSFGQFVSSNNTYNSSFYLTKIETINKTVINFIYNKNGYTLGTYNRNHDFSFSDININYSTHEIVTLSDIYYPGGHMHFNYVFDRLDYRSEPRIQSIQIYEQEINTSTWYLNPSSQDPMYFSANFNGIEQPTLERINSLIQPNVNNYNNDWNTKRLKLNELKHVDKNNKSYSYKFSYNEVNLPTKLSTAVDHWGYFNGETNHDFIPAFLHNVSTTNDAVIEGINSSTNRDANEHYNQAFILKQIIYPTGGKTEFTYESNKFKMNNMENDSHSRDFMYSQQEVSIEGNSTTGLNNIPFHLKTFTIPYASGNPGGGHKSTLNMNLDLTLNSAYKHRPITGEPKLSISIMSGNNIVWSYKYQSPETPDVNQFTGDTWHFTKIFDNIDLYAGDYTLKIDCQEGNMRLYLNDLLFSIKRTIYPHEYLESHPIGVGGGLRVKSVKNFDTANNLLNGKVFKYTNSEDNNDLNSTGKLMAYPHYQYAFGKIGAQGLLNNSYSVGYSEVTVFDVNSLNIQIGKNKYKYINIPNKNLYYTWEEQ